MCTAYNKLCTFLDHLKQSVFFSSHCKMQLKGSIHHIYHCVVLSGFSFIGWLQQIENLEQLDVE